jgi:hypothetical protein
MFSHTNLPPEVSNKESPTQMFLPYLVCHVDKTAKDIAFVQVSPKSTTLRASHYHDCHLTYNIESHPQVQFAKKNRRLLNPLPST